MPRLYHSVPLDEEQNINRDGSEKTIWTAKFDSGVVSSTVEKAYKHWTWLAHAILLSTSMTLFTLSLCNKTSHISDVMVTEQYSSYCMLLSSPKTAVSS